MKVLLIVIGLTSLTLLGVAGFGLWRASKLEHEVRDPLVTHREVLLHQLEAQARTPDIEKYGTIHRRGAECPPGWKLDAGRFTEIDGSTWDACLNPKKQDRWAARGGNSVYIGESVDYLAGGEQLGFSVEIPVAPARRYKQ